MEQPTVRKETLTIPEAVADQKAALDSLATIVRRRSVPLEGEVVYKTEWSRFSQHQINRAAEFIAAMEHELSGEPGALKAAFEDFCGYIGVPDRDDAHHLWEAAKSLISQNRL